MSRIRSSPESNTPVDVGKKSWSRTNWLVMLFNWGAIIALLLSYLAAQAEPSSIGYLVLFGLAYPVILVVNIFFVIYWYFKKRKNAWFSFIVLLAGWGYLTDFFQMNIFRGSDLPGRLKVMTYNVRLFDLYDWNANIEGRNQIFEQLSQEQPDIICFQEFYYSSKKGEFETRDTLIQFLPTKYYHERYTHALNGKQYFGVALFSKFPIIDRGYIPFESDVNNYCIYADLKIGLDTVRVYDAHLASIRFQEEDYAFVDENRNQEEIETGGKRIARRLKRAFIKREEQVKKLRDHLENSPYPVILCGDFNDPPQSYCYQQLSDVLEDSFCEAGRGIGNTYIGSFPSFRIDYILHSDEFEAVEYRTLKEEYSDHHAVTTILAY